MKRMILAVAMLSVSGPMAAAGTVDDGKRTVSPWSAKNGGRAS